MNTAIDFMNFVFLVRYDKTTQLVLAAVLITVLIWLLLRRARAR